MEILDLILEKINENTTELYDTTVKNTGDQTIGGVKTFTTAPVVPDAMLPQHPVTKGVFDKNVTTKKTYILTLISPLG